MQEPDRLQRLIAEYRPMAATASADSLYGLARTGGASKIEAFVLLRELYGLNLQQCQQVADRCEPR